MGYKYPIRGILNNMGRDKSYMFDTSIPRTKRLLRNLFEELQDNPLDFTKTYIITLEEDDGGEEEISEESEKK